MASYKKIHLLSITGIATDMFDIRFRIGSNPAVNTITITYDVFNYNQPSLLDVFQQQLKATNRLYVVDFPEYYYC